MGGIQIWCCIADIYMQVTNVEKGHFVCLLFEAMWRKTQVNYYHVHDISVGQNCRRLQETFAGKSISWSCWHLKKKCTFKLSLYLWIVYFFKKKMYLHIVNVCGKTVPSQCCLRKTVPWSCQHLRKNCIFELLKFTGKLYLHIGVCVKVFDICEKMYLWIVDICGKTVPFNCWHLRKNWTFTLSTFP